MRARAPPKLSRGRPPPSTTLSSPPRSPLAPLHPDTVSAPAPSLWHARSPTGPPRAVSTMDRPAGYKTTTHASPLPHSTPAPPLHSTPIRAPPGGQNRSRGAAAALVRHRAAEAEGGHRSRIRRAAAPFFPSDPSITLPMDTALTAPLFPSVICTGPSPGARRSCAKDTDATRSSTPTNPTTPAPATHPIDFPSHPPPTSPEPPR